MSFIFVNNRLVLGIATQDLQYCAGLTIFGKYYF